MTDRSLPPSIKALPCFTDHSWDESKAEGRYRIRWSAAFAVAEGGEVALSRYCPLNADFNVERQALVKDIEALARSIQRAERIRNPQANHTPAQVSVGQMREALQRNTFWATMSPVACDCHQPARASFELRLGGAPLVGHIVQFVPPGAGEGESISLMVTKVTHVTDDVLAEGEPYTSIDLDLIPGD